MNTKSLLTAVALGAAGVATSMAQTVYSVNVVGYVNLTLTPGFSLIGNQLNTTNNTIANLLPPVPGMRVYKFVPGTGYSIYTFDDLDLVWTPNGNVTLNPGEGAFVQNPYGTNIPVTFVGEVLLDSTTNSIAPGFSIRSAMAPVSGAVDQLGFPASPSDRIYKFNPGTGFTIYTFDDLDLVWTPSIPSVGVGEAFFVSKVDTASWVKDFVP
jgi:hypothetical protein